MPQSINPGTGVEPGLPGAPAPPSGNSGPRRLTRLQATGEAIIATGVILAICYVAELPLVVLLVSILCAFILAPIVDFLVRVRLPRALAALAAVLLTLGVLYGLFYFSYTRAQAFVHELPRYRSEIHRIILHVKRQTQTIQKTASDVLPSGGKSDKHDVTVEPASAWTQLITTNVGSISEVVFTVSLIPFLVYFMLTWQEHARSASVMLFRVENRNTAYVTLGMISSMIRSFIVGNVLVGLFISAISTAVFGFMGVPYFYFVGFMSGYLSLVPYLGVLLAMVPPLGIGLGHIHSTQFIVIVVTVVALHLFALNVLYPKFLGSRLQLNPLAVTLALLFWGWIWGAMGLILAIPITAALKIILDHTDSLRPYGAWLGGN